VAVRGSNHQRSAAPHVARIEQRLLSQR
jgi:hypothetical protein